MAKRKSGDKPSEQTAAPAASEPTKSELPQSGLPPSGLPQIESPSISPAELAPAAEPAAPPAAVAEAQPAPKTFFAKSLFAKPASIKWTPRNKRAAVFAASVTFAALLGAVVGAMGTNAGLAAQKPPADVAGLEERKAMQQSLAHLSKEVASLKASLGAANKSAGSEMKKVADRLAAAAAEVTGSIAPPQTVPPVEEPQATPLPLPRPTSEQMAAQDVAAPPPSAPLPRLAVVPDWSIPMARDGMALVQGHGELYQVVLGAPLPGLGPVQTIKREDGRWMVVTPRGIIVSSRDRHYFE